MLTKGDKWLASTILVLAVAGIWLNMYYVSAHGQGQHVTVAVDGQVIKTFPLKTGYVGEFRVGASSEYNIIEYQDGRVRIREADCPDQVCVRTGWISIQPQQIVCLPYRVVVKVVSDHPADIDDIVR